MAVTNGQTSNLDSLESKRRRRRTTSGGLGHPLVFGNSEHCCIAWAWPPATPTRRVDKNVDTVSGNVVDKCSRIRAACEVPRRRNGKPRASASEARRCRKSARIIAQSIGRSPIRIQPLTLQTAATRADLESHKREDPHRADLSLITRDDSMIPFSHAKFLVPRSSRPCDLTIGGQTRGRLNRLCPHSSSKVRLHVIV